MEALQSIFYWLHGFLGHEEHGVQAAALRIWKYFLSTFAEFSRGFFVMRNFDGTNVDLLNGGFSILVTGSVDEFHRWRIANLAQLETFFGRVYDTAIASKTKKSEKWRADAVKSMEESRKKKGQELLQRLEQRNQA